MMWSDKPESSTRNIPMEPTVKHCTACNQQFTHRQPRHRDGDLCTQPDSPVYPGECNPWDTGAICIGQVKCNVRQVKR
jgi:hypothetical protein